MTPGNDGPPLPPPGAHLAAKKLYEQLVAEYLKPFFKRHGFAKYGMNFVRSRGDIIDAVNFQGSKWNGVDHEHSFFINCGLDSLEFQRVVGATANQRPKAYECLFRDRYAQITGAGQAELTIIPETDLPAFATELLAQLELVLQFFESVATTGALLDIVVGRNWLRRNEDICKYLARTRDAARLSAYITKLHGRFADDPRWPFFSERIRTTVADADLLRPVNGLLAPPEAQETR